MIESDKEIYATLKMTVNPQTGCCDYSNSLQFWRAVESKYQERKRALMEANARMTAARLAAIKARRELVELKRQTEDEIRQVSRSASPSSDEEYEEAKDEEFSDVDSHMFMDPADRYYSSLDAEKWQKIRSDLMKAHQYAFDRKKRIIRRILIALLSLFWLLVCGWYYMFKMTAKIEPPAIEQTPGCLFKCDLKTMIYEFIQMIFISAKTEEEM